MRILLADNFEFLLSRKVLQQPRKGCGGAGKAPRPSGGSVWWELLGKLRRPGLTHQWGCRRRGADGEWCALCGGRVSAAPLAQLDLELVSESPSSTVLGTQETLGTCLLRASMDPAQAPPFNSFIGLRIWMYHNFTEMFPY